MLFSPPEGRIGTIGIEQVLVGDLIAINDKILGRIADGTEAVGDGEHRAAPTESLVTTCRKGARENAVHGETEAGDQLQEENAEQQHHVAGPPLPTQAEDHLCKGGARRNPQGFVNRGEEASFCRTEHEGKNQ